MGCILWIALGTLAGTLAKRFMREAGPGVVMLTISIGVFGAFAGGFAANLVGIGSMEGFNMANLCMAAAASILLLLIYRRVRV